MNVPFEGLLGNSEELRMLEFLLPLNDIEFSAEELSKEIRAKNVSKVIDKFVDYGVLKTITKENKVYYAINQQSQIVKIVVQLNNSIIEDILGDQTLYEIHEYFAARTYDPKIYVENITKMMHRP